MTGFVVFLKEKKSIYIYIYACVIQITDEKTFDCGDHPNYSIGKIGQNTEVIPGDLRRLDVAQTPVRNAGMEDSKGVNNNNKWISIRRRKKQWAWNEKAKRKTMVTTLIFFIFTSNLYTIHSYWRLSLRGHATLSIELHLRNSLSYYCFS